MKNVIKFSVLMFAIVLTFSSCKKELIDKNISAPVLELECYSGDATELNFNEPHLRIDGQVAPDFQGTEITLKVVTGEYPDGYEITVSLSEEKTYEEGDYRYHYKSFSADFKIANHTDDDLEYIKISADDTQVKVIMGDNLRVASFPINNDEILQLTYWNINSATLFLYGYEFDGSQAKSVEMWTSRDAEHITFDLEWNDPTQYQGLPAFNNYNVDVAFWDGLSSQDDLTLGIFYESDTIYVKYDGKTYYSIHDVTTHEPLLEL